MADKNSMDQNKNIQKDNSPIAEKQDPANAYKQAESDIQKDPDLNSEPEQGDDLDEGELARLEGEK